MKKVISLILGLMMFGTLAIAQEQPKQAPPTKAQLEEALKKVRLEKRYLELQSQEESLLTAIKGMETPAKPKKEEPKK